MPRVGGSAARDNDQPSLRGSTVHRDSLGLGEVQPSWEQLA